MKKDKFLKTLGRQLRGLSAEEIRKTQSYYGEMIDDRMEDGLSEEEAVAAMGPPAEIAGRHPEAGSNRRSKARRGWGTAAMIIGSPLWLSLLIAAAAVVLSVYITLWAAVITLYAADLSLAAAGISGIVCAWAYARLGNLPTCILCAGAALICAGGSVLMFRLSCLAARGLFGLSAAAVRRLFRRGGREAFE